MKYLSFEIFPSENKLKIIEIINFCIKKKISFISVTSSKISNYFFIEKYFKNINLKIIPHIICKSLKFVVSEIIKFLKIKIFNFLIISGDENKKTSLKYIIILRKLFGHTVKFLCSIYPESHKQSFNYKKELLFNIKKNKIGVNLYITQFFFNINIVYFYLKNIKKNGINKNYTIGIIPKKNINEIFNFLNICNVSIDTWIIKNLKFLNLEKIFIKIIKKVKNIHFYTFNDLNLINYFK